MSITSFTPTNGTENTFITINGTNFLNNPRPTIKIGGVNVDVNYVNFISPTKITCIAPVNNPGNYTIEVINNNNQNFITTDLFTYNQSSPTITSFTPNNGRINTLIAINGTNFLNNPPPTVKIGGVNATQVTLISSTEITCVAPTNNPGNYTIEVINNDNQNFTTTDIFTYIEGPTITSFAPNNGIINTLITINGTNFLNNPPPTVKIGGVNATQVTFITSSELTCVSPANNLGNYTIEVINNDTQHFTTTDVFTYNQSPTITSFTPNNGPVNTLLRINGTNFLNNPPPTIKIGGVNATQVTLISSTQLTCLVPENNVGNYTIEVINSDTQNFTTLNFFTYIPVSLITTIINPLIYFADGITSATIQVTATNLINNSKVSNLFINLTSSTTTAIITPLNNQLTDANGQLIFTVTDTTIGNTTFTASVVTISSSNIVNFIQVPSNHKLYSTSSNVFADGISTATIIEYVGIPNFSFPIISIQNPPKSAIIMPINNGISNAAGIAYYLVSSNSIETVIFSSFNQQEVTIDFISPFSTTTSEVRASSGTFIANGVSFSTITVLLKNDTGTILTNGNISLRSNSATSIISGATNNGINGITFNVTNTKAEVVIYTGYSGTSVILQTASVTFLPGPFNASTSTVTSALANVSTDSTTTLTVFVCDANSNGISGSSVTLSAINQSASITITAISSTTDINGNASFRISNTFAQLSTFQAAVNGTPITNTASVTFLPGAVNATKSTFTSDISTVSTDAGTAVNLTAFLCDANRNAISGQSISITETSSTISSIQAVTTGANGIAMFSITNTKAEQVTFTASVVINTVSTQLGQAVVVTFTPGIVSTLQSSFITPTITTISTDNSTTILSFLVRDQNQNPIPNKTVILATNPANYSVVSSTPTDATGTATITIQNKVAETVTFNASSSGIPIGAQQLIFAPGQYSIITSTLSASLNAVSTDSDGRVTLTATIRDKNQNTIPSKAVTLSTTIVSSVSVAVSTTQSTNTNGQVTFNITNTKAETVTFIASANDGTQGVSMNQQATIAFLVGALSTTTSTISSATPSSIVADGVVTSAITVTVKDKNQNRIPGLPILLTPSTGARISAQTITSIQSSDVIFTLKSTVAESLTLTASSGQTQIGLPVNLTFVPGPFSQISSSITALSNQVTTDNDTTTTLNVIVCDFFKNTISGSTVTISANSMNPTISPTNRTTGADGAATFTVYNNKAQSVIFTGLVQPQGSQTNTAITNTSTITFFPGNPLPSNCLISITKGSDPFTVNGRNVPINVTLRDMHANNIIGLATSLKGTKTDNSISTTFRCSPSISDSNGIVALQVNNSAEEQVTCVPTFNFSLAWTSPNVSLNFKIGPRITGVAPNCGRPGKNITLYGQNFLANTSVKINGQAATIFKLLSKSKMICTVPANNKGRYPIVVTNPNDTSFTSPLFNSY